MIIGWGAGEESAAPGAWEANAAEPELTASLRQRGLSGWPGGDKGWDFAADRAPWVWRGLRLLPLFAGRF